MSPETHDPELASLAKALAELAPSAGRLDRDQVLFRAGQASAEPRSRFWRRVAATTALLAVALGLSPFLRLPPQRVQTIVYQRVEPPASLVDRVAVQPLPPPNAAQSQIEATVRQPERLSYARLQRMVFTSGVDALPNPSAAFGAQQQDPLLNGPTDVLGWNHLLRIQTP